MTRPTTARPVLKHTGAPKMRDTLVVRKVMQLHGRKTIFTNRYAKCHTVKCYAKDRTDFSMIEDIKKFVEKAGYTCTVKRTDRPIELHQHFRDAVIVRLPL